MRVRRSKKVNFFFTVLLIKFCQEIKKYFDLFHIICPS